MKTPADYHWDWPYFLDREFIGSSTELVARRLPEDSCFLSIRFPNESRLAAPAGILDGVRSKPTPPERFHLTLIVAEQCSDDQLALFLANLSPIMPFSVEVTGLRLIDGMDSPVLVWSVDPGPALSRMQAELYNAVIDEDMVLSPYSKPADWLPHITVAYDLDSALIAEDLPQIEPFRLMVNSFEIGRSHDDFFEVHLPRGVGDRMFVQQHGGGHTGQEGRPGSKGGSQAGFEHADGGGRRAAADGGGADATSVTSANRDSISVSLQKLSGQAINPFEARGGIWIDHKGDVVELEEGPTFHELSARDAIADSGAPLLKSPFQKKGALKSDPLWTMFQHGFARGDVHRTPTGRVTALSFEWGKDAISGEAKNLIEDYTLAFPDARVDWDRWTPEGTRISGAGLRGLLAALRGRSAYEKTRFGIETVISVRQLAKLVHGGQIVKGVLRRTIGIEDGPFAIERAGENMYLPAPSPGVAGGGGRGTDGSKQDGSKTGMKKQDTGFNADGKKRKWGLPHHIPVELFLPDNKDLQELSDSLEEWEGGGRSIVDALLPGAEDDLDPVEELVKAQVIEWFDNPDAADNPLGADEMFGMTDGEIQMLLEREAEALIENRPEPEAETEEDDPKLSKQDSVGRGRVYTFARDGEEVVAVIVTTAIEENDYRVGQLANGAQSVAYREDRELLPPLFRPENYTDESFETAYLFVDWMAVKREGHGYGRAMLGEIFRQAAETESGVYLETTDSAKAFYEEFLVNTTNDATLFWTAEEVEEWAETVQEETSAYTSKSLVEREDINEVLFGSDQPEFRPVSVDDDSEPLGGDYTIGNVLWPEKPRPWKRQFRDQIEEAEFMTDEDAAVLDAALPPDQRFPDERETMLQGVQRAMDNLVRSIFKKRHGEHIDQEGEKGRRGGSQKGFEHANGGTDDEGKGEIKLFRGISQQSPKGGRFYSPDKEFARQFTQTGREEEVEEISLSETDIYEADEIPFANDFEAIDAALDEAEAQGKKAIWVDEGRNQPNSVMFLEDDGEITESEEVFHGTGAEAARSIMDSGLQIDFADDNNFVSDVVYAAADRRDALNFAARNTEENYALITIDGSLVGSEPTISDRGELMFGQDIPAEAIVRIEIYQRGFQRKDDELIETIERSEEESSQLFIAAAINETGEYSILGPGPTDEDVKLQTIADFRTNAYQDINAYLQDDSELLMMDDVEIESMIEILDGILEESLITESVVTFRGMDLEDQFERNFDALEGEVFSFRGYTPTAVDVQVLSVFVDDIEAEEAPVLLEIRVPEGTPAIYMDDDQELLLDRGLQFRVVEVGTTVLTGQEVRSLTVEVVPGSGYNQPGNLGLIDVKAQREEEAALQAELEGRARHDDEEEIVSEDTSRDDDTSQNREVSTNDETGSESEIDEARRDYWIWEKGATTLLDKADFETSQEAGDRQAEKFSKEQQEKDEDEEKVERAVAGPLRRIVTIRHGKHIDQAGEEGRRGGSQAGFKHEEGSIEGTTDTSPTEGGGKAGVSTKRRAVESNEFQRAFEVAMEDNDRAGYVTAHSSEELEGMRALYLSEDGKAGFAIRDHGGGKLEATQAFNKGAPKGSFLEMLKESVNKDGVNYVEAFAPLHDYYARAGFVVETESEWNPEFAPDNWNEADGTPNYYTMRLGKKNGDR